SYNTLIDFLTDFALPGQRRFQQFQQAFGQSAFEFSTNDYNFFFQDDIRVDSRLTVNVGLRYEYQQLPQAQIANPLFAATAEMPSDKNNFGPRFGFAYDVTGDGKTSVRGGFGMYYGRIINSTISNAITNTGTATSQRTFTFFPTTVGAPLFPNVLAGVPATTTTVAPSIVAFAGDFENPQIYQGDFIIEREIARNTIVSASYLFSAGRNLPTFVDINLPAPITNPTPIRVVGGPFDGQSFTLPIFATAGGARPNRDFGVITQIRSDVDSQYDALVLQLNRRLTAGLQLQTNYTLATATDSGQTSQTFTTANAPLNPFDRSLEKSTSNFDIRHRFVASAVYTPNNFFGLGESSLGRAIFNGFTIAPIVSISSGAPYTAFINGNATAPAGTTRIGSGVLGAGGTNRAPFIERNAFRFPSTAVLDLRISRRFNLGETRNIEILAEGFNLFNRQNITGIGTTAYVLSGSTLNFQGVGGPASNPTFGIPNEAGNTIYRERQIQLALRFQF
ncbi:MAG: TonB-dependent receptor, partial [Pyrinomonadaceae bacterium]